MPWLRSLALLFLCTTVSAAADWPQWLGPTRDGVSPEKVAPWKEAPKVLWRQPVGEGHSSPVVADGKVFVHGKVKGKDQEDVQAFDAKSGKPLWKAEYDRGKFENQFGNGPRGTPAVVGGKVYTLGVTGFLSCFEADSGKKVWQIDTAKEFKPPSLFFGVSGSPLIEGDAVLVNVGGKGASIVAFNKDKGDVLWKTGDDLTVNVHVEADRSFTCSKCLEEFNNVFEKDITLHYDIKGLDSVTIDQDVRDELILDHPIRVLCRPDCRGLCPYCGVNLNEERCDCKPADD